VVAVVERAATQATLTSRASEVRLPETAELVVPVATAEAAALRAQAPTEHLEVTAQPASADVAAVVVAAAAEVASELPEPRADTADRAETAGRDRTGSL
jgi:hypothetical protein